MVVIDASILAPFSGFIGNVTAQIELTREMTLIDLFDFLPKNYGASFRCILRSDPITNSAVSRSLVPEQIDHWFQNKSIISSAGNRSLVPLMADHFLTVNGIGDRQQRN